MRSENLQRSGSIGLIVAVAICPSALFADGFDFSHWARMPREWKSGFASASALNLATVVDPAEAASYPTTMSYRRCFSDQMNPDVLVALIENYVSRHPDKFSMPMAAIAIQTFREACAPFFK